MDRLQRSLHPVGARMVQIVALIGLAVFASCTGADDLSTMSDPVVDDVAGFVAAEEWGRASRMARTYLDSTNEDYPDRIARLRYLSLVSMAGEVVSRGRSFDGLQRAVEAMVGERVITTPYVVSIQESDISLNTIKIAPTSMSEGHITMTTRDKGVILVYVDVTFRDPLDRSGIERRLLETRGDLESFEVRTSSPMVWILRLKVADATARVLQR